MQDSKNIERVARGLEASQKTSTTAAGQAEAGQRAKPTSPEQIDTINQVFALFRLNYHNQYYSAWGNDEQLAQIKKLWLGSLAAFSSEQVLRGARRCVEHSEYLPTLNKMLEYCRQELGAIGLIDAHAAFIEACQAGSPKSAQAWSHPAVYLAGCASDWFFLANNPERMTFPVYQRHYNNFCDRVLAGETFEIETPKAIPEHSAAPLSRDEQIEMLRQLRENVGL